MALAAIGAAALLSAARLEANETAGANLVHREWSVEDGLPQSTVTSILESRDGFLWIATHGGLARFDGTSFKILPLTTPDGRVRLRVRRLLQDRRDRLWVGTEGDGVGFLEGERFVAVEGFAGRLVVDVAEDTRGRIWVATTADGVWTVAGDSLEVNRALPDLVIPRVTAFTITADDTVWIGAGSHLLRVTDGDRVAELGPADGVPPFDILGISRSLRGGVWLALDGGGVVCVTDRVIEHYSDSVLDSGQQWTVLEDRLGDVWLGGYPGSVQRVRDGRVEEMLSSDELAGGPVLALHEDRTGALWIGTSTRGLHRLTKGLFTVWNRASGELPRDAVLAVTEDQDGVVWAGLNCGGLIAVEGDRVRHVPVPINPPGGCVWSVLAAADGSLWFGTWGGGVGRLRAGGFEIPVEAPGIGPGTVINALFQSNDGAVWIGTRGGGAYRWHDGDLEHFDSSRGLPSDSVRCFAEDAAGRLWMGTTDGLARFADGAFEALPAALAWRGARVRAISIDDAGRMWVGTYGLGLGLVRDDRLLHFDRRHGLADDVVSAVLDDGSGHLWLSGNRGIFRLAIAELLAIADGSQRGLVPAAFGTDHGLPTVEAAGGFQPSAWRARDGRLFFPTIGGLVAIDPADLAAGRPPKALIEELLVDGTPLPAESTVVLPAGRHRIEIRFSGLDLSAPGTLAFRYRLAGVDDDWVSAGPGRAAVYHSVGPGSYRFEVQTLTPAGGWSDPPAAMALRVPRVIWLRWWFLLLIGVAVVVTPAAAVRWRAIRSERLLQERAALLRRFEVAIVHEFRQPLQVLVARLEILSQLIEGERERESIAQAQRAIVRLQTLADRIEHVHEDDSLSPLRYAADEMMFDLRSGSES